MGNVQAKAAGIVLKTVDKVKKTIKHAMHKVAETVRKICEPIRDKLVDLACMALIGTIRFQVKHPRLFQAMLKIAAGCLVFVVLSAIVLSVMLPIVGFTSGGIAGGSLAAAWHASIGNVGALSLFAILQSAAAGGYGVSIVVGSFVAAGGLGGIMCSLMDRGYGRGGGLGLGPPPASDGSGPDDHAKQT